MTLCLFTRFVFRYIALHILNESVNLIFPSDKTFAQIAADIKVYSPAENRTCQDITNTLKFKLAFDGDEKYIRGDVKVVIDDQVEYLQMYMYEKCRSNERRDDYLTVIIEDTYQALESNGRTCFKDADPFYSYGTGNAMSLESTPNGFGCEVYMILPEYMHVEDERLPAYTKLPLNSSFDENDEKFWWKSENDSMLPDQISFDSSKNVVINILNSTKDVPYFFRIGSGQPIPTFKFNFGAKCKHAKFELYLNLKHECHTLLHLSENGFSVSTKITSNTDFKGLPSLMIFGGKFVSVKVDTPLSIKSLEICELSNQPDVPLDQFVLQISPVGDVGGCEKAEIVLLNSDMINGTEVLIDRSKIAESINATTETENNSTIASLVTTSKPSVESAEFAWWWILVGGILLLGFIAAIIVSIICIRRRRQQKKKLPPVESIVEDEEVGRITIKTKNALSPEKLSKEMKPKIVAKEKKEEPAKKKVLKEVADAKGNQKPAKLLSIQPPKPIQKPKSELPLQSAEPSKQQPLKSLKPASTQKSGTKREPPPPAILPKPLRNLKFRSIYGIDKATKLDEPFDYHENESSKFEPTKIPPKFVQPDFRVLTNFWDCLGEILTTKRFCPVYADNFDGGHTNVFFIVRDLVSNENYLPLRCLSNRMLEVIEPPEGKKSPVVNDDGRQRIKTDGYYCLRVFILSYDPLSVEIHCRGPWPHFIFNVGECSRCFDLYKELYANDWKNCKFLFITIELSILWEFLSMKMPTKILTLWDCSLFEKVG
uniref:Uncharacterized protein n=1 Tax=Panagrolaimus davidi TaxID=227884 RepID=A0A914P3L1_9BILA